MNAAHHFIARDFAAKTRRALLKRGIVIIGAANLPGPGTLPFANGKRGYCLDNNGQRQIRTYSEVEALVCETVTPTWCSYCGGGGNCGYCNT